MSVYVDVRCNKCEELYEDVWSTEDGTPCICGGTKERVYTLTVAPTPGGSAAENVVVYVSPAEGGRVQYPGRTDQPIPERLLRRGYERVSISPRELGAFEKKHKVMNEKRHFNNGNGL